MMAKTKRPPVTDGCCGAPCDLADDTCWGEIDVVDEEYNRETGDSRWIHACAKHRGDEEDGQD
jgi:hypothetical protein